MGVAIINHVDGQPCFLDTFFFSQVLALFFHKIPTTLQLMTSKCNPQIYTVQKLGSNY